MTNDALPDDSDRISAVGFLFKLWDERIFIVFTTIVFLIGSQLYIYRTTDLYTTTMLIGHVASMEGTPGASSSGSALGGAIALIGLGNGTGTDTKFNLFLTFIRTQKFAKALQEKYHFENKHSETVLDSLPAVQGMLGRINFIGGGDTMTMSMQIHDKKFAEYFMPLVMKEGNEFVRILDTERAKLFTAFIENRFRTETSKPMQDALGSLLVNQERFLMLTSVDLPYAVQMLDVAQSTDAPTAPKKSLIRTIGLSVGLGTSVFIILLWEAIAGERSLKGLFTPGPSQVLRNLPYYAKKLFRKLTGRIGSGANSAPGGRKL